MRLKFNNIGIIKEADILIDGLTVLAGQNDTGKSTVGKLIYTLIKVTNNYKQVLKMNQSDSLRKMINELSEIAEQKYRKKLREFTNDQGDQIEFNFDNEDPNNKGKNQSDKKAEILKYTRLIRILNHHNREVKSKINKIINNDNIGDSDVMSIIKDYIEINELNDEYFSFEKYRKEIKRIKRLDYDSFEVQKAAFDLMIENEFNNQISSTNINELSRVKLFEKDFNVIDISISKNEISGINALNSSAYTDITYIDTPFQLQDYSTRELMNSRVGKRYFQKHSDDLMKKLYISHPEYGKDSENIIFEIERREYTEKFEKIIQQVIGGEFEYSQKIRNFVYRRNGDEYRLVNTATGIRAFAMLKILLNSAYLVKDAILIIDEPEVHLHPQWQMDYAELLVRMVKELEIKVVINSHSPYMIEAFKVYSDHYGISGITNFYNMQREGNFTEVIWANNSLGEIFDELSIPFSKLDKLRIADFDK